MKIFSVRLDQMCNSLNIQYRYITSTETPLRVLDLVNLCASLSNHYAFNGITH